MGRLFLSRGAATAVGMDEVPGQASHPAPPPRVLGWREHVALPALGIARLRAKIDTGARSCALHVDACWRFVEGGAPWVGFTVTPRRGGQAALETRAAILDERDVADSSGRRTRRIFIRTPLRIAGIQREVEINLADRCGMLFPMLVGRTALQHGFVVDPSLSFTTRRPGPAARAAAAAREAAGGA